MTTQTTNGEPCPKCGGTEKYVTSGECVPCKRARGRQQSRAYRAARMGAKAPEAPARVRRPSGYPTFVNEHGEKVHQDPIWVKFHAGEEIGEYTE